MDSEVTQLADRFERDWNAGRIAAFYEFVREIEELVRGGAIAEDQGARAIAGAMFVPGVDDDPLREEITMVAGSLESPARNPAHTWTYLRQLVDELGEQAAA